MESGNTPNGLASIIIRCWNQLEVTRHCIAALTNHTRQPWELIVVNNGSTDATPDHLAGVQDAASVPVTLIANATNRGFPTAINQGLQVAGGEYLVLLNNDVVVTDGWLEQLIALAEAKVADKVRPASECQDAGAVDPDASVNPEIGLVGPMSNYAAPPQLVAEVPYRDLDEMHAFAKRWRDEHLGKWFTVPKLSGFCLLIKRALYDAIGGLMNGSGSGSSTTMTWPSGRGGLDLRALSHTICSFTISAAGRSWAVGSTPGSCWMKTHSGSRPSGACRGYRASRLRCTRS